MIRISWLLRNPKTLGFTSIYCTARWNGTTTIIHPGESIHSSLWINKNGINKPKSIADNMPLIGRLNKFEVLIRDTYEELLKTTTGAISGDDLKKAVYEKVWPTAVTSAIKETYNPILITDFFQMMIDDSLNKKRLGQDGKAISKPTIITYQTTKKHFTEYQKKRNKKYYLKDINQNLIDGFAEYLSIDLNMASNGSGKYMKTFRTMMNYAKQKKHISSDVLAENKVRVTKETPDNIYLNEVDIEDMMKIKEFDSDLQEIVRDLFVIGCRTGLRFSDYSTLTAQKINNGFIHLTQQKTQGRVTIPIHPIVAEILAKYPDGLPKCPPNQVFNRYLKEIGKKLPQLDVAFEKILTRAGKPDPVTYKKYMLLQSHTARRSFCTNEYLNGTPTITIMAISGHKSEKSFIAYIKADSLQHAILMMKGWQERTKKKDDNTDPEEVAA